MRIRELHQRRFGCFTDDELPLILEGDDSAVPGLHVVYGRNEAGKTTTLHAIRYGLYGIPDLRNDPRTYDFLHRKPDLRIAMVIESAAGERIAFTRRKKTGVTCFDITDTMPSPGAQAQLDLLLRGVDRDLFTYKYGIDNSTLRAGGEGLASDHSDLGESLFAATTGIVGVHATLRSLAGQIDELLKATGRSGRIADAVRRFNDARIAAEKARKAGRSWLPKQKEIETAKKSFETLTKNLATVTAEHERATHVSDAIADIVERGLLLQQIGDLGDVIDVWSADLEQQRRDLRTTVATTEAELLTTTSDLQAEVAKEAELSAAVDDAVVAATDRARNLGERIAEYLSAKGDRAKLAAALEQAQTAVAAACRAISAGADVGRAQELIPPLPARDAARTLLSTHTDLHREAAAAAEALEACDGALETFDAEVPAASPALPGLDVVKTAVERLETVDTARLAQLEERLQVKSRQLSDAAKALPRCSHSVDALLALPAPVEQTVDAFDEELRAAQSKVAQLDAALATSNAALEAADAEVATLTQGRDLPTGDELSALRAKRDSLWQRIRTAWAGDGPSDNSGEIAVGGEGAIATAFEDAVRSADGHADRMVLAGEIVGKIAAAQQVRSASAAEIAHHELDRADALGEVEQVEAEWRALWTEIKVNPGTVSEMRAWLAQLRALREIAATAESDSVDAGSLRKRVERARSDLSGALTAAHSPPASDDISVEILQGTAKDILRAADRAREAAVKRDAERSNLETNANKARLRANTAHEALDAWRRQWNKAAPAIGLDVDALPETGSAMVEAIGALEDALESLANAQHAHDANDLLVTAFEAEAEDLVSSIGGELARVLAGKTADHVVREVAQAARACETAADNLTKLAPEIEKLKDRERKQRNTITSATDELNRLAAGAELASIEELDAAAVLWAQRESLRARVTVADHSIVEITKMAPIEVVDFLGETPPDQLPALIAERETAITDATTQRDTMRETLDTLQYELFELQEAAQPEPHLADMDDARAEIERLAVQYVPLKLQHDLLANYLREKASRHMGPAMKRAGAIFSDLTCGDYVGVTQDVDDADREVLKVVPNGRPTMDRIGLSTGTGDQLFLALRLASIYQQLDQPGNEPIPFIVDDILTAFDDVRSAATMRVLGELATRTQVLFFTHHKHLVDLARAEVPPSVLRVLELG